MYNDDQKTLIDKITGIIEKLQAISKQFLIAKNDSQALVSAVQDTPPDFFKITTGLGKLAFDSMFSHTAYYGPIYNAIKILHFIELHTPSDEDFEMLKTTIITQKPALQPNLEAIIGEVKDLRERSVEFYKQITEFLKFIENFNKQKAPYHIPTGTEVLDIYANIDRLSLPAAPASSTSSLPTNSTVPLVPPAPSAPGFTPPPPPALGFAPPPPGSTGSSTPYMYSSVNSLRDLLTKTDLQFSKEAQLITGKPQDILDQRMQVHYAPFADKQIEYFRTIDFTKITNEEHALHFVRQLMTCIDLYLRAAIHTRLNQGIIAAAYTKGESIQASRERESN